MVERMEREEIEYHLRKMKIAMKEDNLKEVIRIATMLQQDIDQEYNDDITGAAI